MSHDKNHNLVNGSAQLLGAWVLGHFLPNLSEGHIMMISLRLTVMYVYSELAGVVCVLLATHLYLPWSS